ncbi:MAG: hypothetical protein M3Z96_00735 [Pseudomonadota bacterium]|nr:hypothetical protein [Pseudomonadota bacterium]
MNTKTAEQLKRWSAPTSRAKIDSPRGDYKYGIHNKKFAQALGELVGQWTRVEEEMIAILRILLGGERNAPAREIFNSLVSERVRYDLMKLLLEQTPINRNREPVYDEVLTEFWSLRGIRNDYVHGLWATHECGKVFLSLKSTDDSFYLRQRHVSLNQMTHEAKRMRELTQKILVIEIQERRQRLRARRGESSPGTPPPLVDGKSI